MSYYNNVLFIYITMYYYSINNLYCFFAVLYCIVLIIIIGANYICGGLRILKNK